MKSELAIPETPIERPRSLAAPSVSPETSAPHSILQVPETTSQPMLSQVDEDLLKKQYEVLQKKGYTILFSLHIALAIIH